MDAGANFASSPGRININALDPAILSEKVALTDRRYYVTPEEVSSIIISGSAGVGGINTKAAVLSLYNKKVAHPMLPPCLSK